MLTILKQSPYDDSAVVASRLWGALAISASLSLSIYIYLSIYAHLYTHICIHTYI